MNIFYFVTIIVITTSELPTWLVFFQSMVLMAGPGYMSMRLWWW